eukprot:m.73286 g.73286  ORF g.73286 m.73286 type:complete len:379 (+) comp8827_c0_seq3:302-1438(+)
MAASVFREIKATGGDADALALLRRAAEQATPIMRKRQWSVGVLEEFYPKSQGLLGLNVNRGARIKVRLRQPGDRKAFLPYNSVLGTLLHELVHIVHGNHSADFYRLLDELWDECEQLMDRGITGDTTGAGAPGFSFTGTGQRLDGSQRNPTSGTRGTAKQRAADAALQRQGRRVGGRPRTLGGKRKIMQTKTPRELAAEAALRRQRDDVWCGANGSHDAGEQQAGHAGASGAPAGASAAVGPVGGGGVMVAGAGQRTHADGLPARRRAERGRLMDSTSEVAPPTSSLNPPTRKPRTSPHAASQGSRRPALESASGASAHPNPVAGSSGMASSSGGSVAPIVVPDSPPVAVGTLWTCRACTFANSKQFALVCEVCGTVR